MIAADLPPSSSETGRSSRPQVSLQFGRQPLEGGRALGWRPRRPARRVVEGAAGGGDGAVDVGLGPFRDRADVLAGGGVADLDGGGRARRRPAAADEQGFVACRHGRTPA